MGSSRGGIGWRSSVTALRPTAVRGLSLFPKSFAFGLSLSPPLLASFAPTYVPGAGALAERTHELHDPIDRALNVVVYHQKQHHRHAKKQQNQ